MFEFRKKLLSTEAIEFNFQAKKHGEFSARIVVAEAGSKATIIESYESSGESFTNSAIQIFVEDNANLTHYRVQKESAGSVSYGTTEVDA